MARESSSRRYAPYQPGDEVRSIDWNVTARVGSPHVKTYVEERQLVLQFLVDTSRSMDFGSGTRTKRDVAAEVCALLAFVAASQQDQVGLCLFGDEPGLHLNPDKGTRHILRVVREVVAAPAQLRGEFPSARCSSTNSATLKRRSLVLVVSDFLGLEGEDWSDTPRAPRTSPRCDLRAGLRPPWKTSSRRRACF